MTCPSPTRPAPRHARPLRHALLHAAGVDLARLGRRRRTRPIRVRSGGSSRRIGTCSPGPHPGYWLEEELDPVLGHPSAARRRNRRCASTTRSPRSCRLPEFRPRALFDRFGIEVLATTDDPLDDLSGHAALQRGGCPGACSPPSDPTAISTRAAEGFAERCRPPARADGRRARRSTGYLAALEDRREHFRRHGAVSADHGVEEPFTVDLDPSRPSALPAVLARRGIRRGAARRSAAHMLLQMARMSVDDGLVMTVHAGVLRNHSAPTFGRFGADTGHDIPVRTDFTRGLRPLLERFGLERDFHLVLFAVDETVYSREIAPLAGFYPRVHRRAVVVPGRTRRDRAVPRPPSTETAGFSRGSGFIDDTRAFLSIPARHDTARRADAAFLARLVAEGRAAWRPPNGSPTNRRRRSRSGCSSCDRHRHDHDCDSRAAPRAARAHRPPRAGRVRAVAHRLVHRPRRRRGRLGHRRLHRTQPRARRCTRRPGRPLHLDRAWSRRTTVHEVIGSIARAHAGADISSLLEDLAAPDDAIVTLTITEAGYLPHPGRLRWMSTAADVVADLATASRGRLPRGRSRTGVARDAARPASFSDSSSAVARRRSPSRCCHATICPTTAGRFAAA